MTKQKQLNDALVKFARHGIATGVQVALKEGADVHAYEDEPLKWACSNGHTSTVKVLLQAGADIHARGDRALREASWYGHTEVVALLKQYGAKQ